MDTPKAKWRHTSRYGQETEIQALKNTHSCRRCMAVGAEPSISSPALTAYPRPRHRGQGGGGQGLTSMFNRKSRGRRRRKKWRDLEAVVPLQAVYSGAKDSQLILFTLYSLWDFRMCIFVYCAWMCFILFKGHDYRIQYRGFYFR